MSLATRQHGNIHLAFTALLPHAVKIRGMSWPISNVPNRSIRNKENGGLFSSLHALGSI